MSAELCPRCDGKVVHTNTRWGLRRDCPVCELHAWGSGELVSQRVHDARRRAHAAFDPVWKSGEVKRRVAYGMLARHMGITREECHMKLFDEEQCERVVEAVRVLWPKLASVDNRRYGNTREQDTSDPRRATTRRGA